MPHISKPGLAIFCFERFRLYMDGTPVYLKSRKAEELIALLVCEKGQTVSKKVLAEKLWPNAGFRQALDSLYKVCRYIRTLNEKGVSLPVVSAGEKLYLDIKNIYCDLYEFEELYSRREEPAVCEQALALYRGPMLYEEYYEWVEELEAYYDVRYFGLLEKMIAYYEEKGLQRAAEALKEIFEK